MSKNYTATLERGLLEWLAEDVMARHLRNVPEQDRASRLNNIREQVGELLCTAPVVGDPVAELQARAEIAAAFAATYNGVEVLGQGVFEENPR